MHRFPGAFVAVLIVAAACGGSAEPTTAATVSAPATTAAAGETQAPATTVSPATTVTPTTASVTTTVPSTTAAPAQPMVVGDDGVVTIEWSALSTSPFFAPPVASSDDPFFHIHTNPEDDGFFLSIEAYTTYGAAWTGETGTFAVDCSPNGSGICMYFDVDGPGAVPVSGSNFDATGSITIVKLDASGYEVVLENIVFSEGFTIPGPVTLSG